MTFCGFRPHLQRRVRPGFSPGSLPGQNMKIYPRRQSTTFRKPSIYIHLAFTKSSKAQLVYHTVSLFSILLGGLSCGRFLCRRYDNDILVYIHAFFGLFVQKHRRTRFSAHCVVWFARVHHRLFISRTPRTEQNTACENDKSWLISRSLLTGKVPIFSPL